MVNVGKSPGDRHLYSQNRQPDTFSWCRAIPFLFVSPALLPLFVRTVISHRLRPSGDPPGGARGVLSTSIGPKNLVFHGALCNIIFIFARGSLCELASRFTARRGNPRLLCAEKSNGGNRFPPSAEASPLAGDSGSRLCHLRFSQIAHSVANLIF